MSLRKSQRQPQPDSEQQPTEQEPDTPTKVAEGSVLKGLYELRDDNENDPVIRNAAKVLERSTPKLTRKEWYTFLRTVRDGSNLHKDMTQILNEIATGAAERTHTVPRYLYWSHDPFSGGFCKCLCNSVLLVVLIVLAFLGNENILNGTE